MNTGQLKTRLTIEQPVLTPDGGGGFALSWDEVAEVYGHIADLAGNETLQSRQLEAAQPCRITLLYREDVNAKMRLSNGATHYEIVSLRDPDGGRAWLEIIAKVM